MGVWARVGMCESVRAPVCLCVSGLCVHTLSQQLHLPGDTGVLTGVPCLSDHSSPPSSDNLSLGTHSQRLAPLPLAAVPLELGLLVLTCFLLGL